MPRRVKDDSKPKGRMTSYAYFIQVCREDHKKQYPDENVVFAEFSRKCAERWKNISEKEKKRFQDMADRDKNRYEHEMKDYVPVKGEKGHGKKRRQVKDPNAPKRSLTSFFWFCNDERPRVKGLNPEYRVGDVAKELGKLWAVMNPEMKRKYEAMSERDKARYEREMAAYKKRGNVALAPQSHQEEDDEDDDDDDEGDEDE